MSSKMAIVRCAAAVVTAGLISALGAGCLVDTGDEDAEDIGTVAQALGGEGDRCGPGYLPCDENLTCCWKATQQRWYCRALQTDENNCGACGYVCPIGYICMEGECQYFGK